MVDSAFIVKFHSTDLKVAPYGCITLFEMSVPENLSMEGVPWYDLLGGYLEEDTYLSCYRIHEYLRDCEDPEVNSLPDEPLLTFIRRRIELDEGMVVTGYRKYS